MATKKRSLDSSTTWTVIGGGASVVAALVAFLVTFVVKPSQPSNSLVTNSAVVSFTGIIGLNLDTNPPTVGPSSEAPLVVVDLSGGAVSFTAILPLSLAYITNNTSTPPVLSACQRVITSAPVLRVNIKDKEWICVRTAQGATKAIRIASATSSNVEIQVYNLHNLYDECLAQHGCAYAPSGSSATSGHSSPPMVSAASRVNGSVGSV